MALGASIAKTWEHEQKILDKCASAVQKLAALNAIQEEHVKSFKELKARVFSPKVATPPAEPVARTPLPPLPTLPLRFRSKL
jgi:hypothetical protein